MPTPVLGIEIGGTKLQTALGDSGGAVGEIRRGVVRPAEGAQGILQWLRREIPPLLEKASTQGAPARAIGAGFGGPVESAAGRILLSHQIEGWTDFALKPWLEDSFGLPAVVANDSNAAGWAEWRLGAGRDTRAFAYMNIGSGIGGALILDGRLWDGQGRGAGEIGHARLPAGEMGVNGDLPLAGDCATLESRCSGWAIEKRLREGPAPAPDTPLGRLCGGRPQALTCAMLGEAARQGDARARGELERVGQCIGMALGHLISLIHPERVAIGGGVALIGEPLFEPIRRWTDEYVIGVFRGRYSIVPCELRDHVVLAGAMLLAGDSNA